MHGSWLDNISFFHCDDATERSEFAIEVAQRLRRSVYAHDEILVRAGEVASALSIIERGVVATSTGFVKCTGRFWGAEMLLHRGRHRCTCKTVTYVTVMALDKARRIVLL